VTTDFELF